MGCSSSGIFRGWSVEMLANRRFACENETFSRCSKTKVFGIRKSPISDYTKSKISSHIKNLRFLNEIENVKEGTSRVGHLKMFHFQDDESLIRLHTHLFLRRKKRRTCENVSFSRHEIGDFVAFKR